MTSRVIVSIRVPCSPIQAFEVFTEEIGDWWVHNDLFRLSRRSPGALAFEPPDDTGRGGRLIERLSNGETFELGPVRTWSPGERLVVGWRHASFGPEHATEVEIRFEPMGEETRVTVEHRGWDSVPQAHVARHGFPLQMTNQRQGDQWRASLEQFRQRAEIPRPSPDAF
jgi:Activator of Hsp90 ATPase homolog 1-like protein